jgi:transcriptional regulator with XRE-family HTH domain
MQRVPVSELVELLFRTHLKPDGRQYSNREVARGINSLGLGDITPAYIAKLRRDDTLNPSRDVLSKLCLFFQVPSSYFFPELDRFTSSQAETTTSDDPSVRLHMIFRSAGLTKEEQEQVEGLFNFFRRKKSRDQ